MKYIDKGTVETQYWNIHIAGDIKQQESTHESLHSSLDFVYN
ncbi:UNVERIFIED_ORG: hypothetical protein [Escherichia phage CMSTMSU]